MSPGLRFTDSEIALYTDKIYKLKLDTEFGTTKTGTFNVLLDLQQSNRPSSKNSDGNYELADYITTIKQKALATSEYQQGFASLDYGKSWNAYWNLKSSIELGSYDNSNIESLTLYQNTTLSTFDNPWSRAIQYQNYYLENNSTIHAHKITSGFSIKNSQSNTQFIQNVGRENSAASQFDYDEKISSFFLNDQISKGEFEYTLAITLEKTDVQGGNGPLSQKLNFVSFLPNFAINHQNASGTTWSLNFDRSISRPGYTWLNQQELFRNLYVRNIGGGVLRPTLSHKFTASISWPIGLSLTGIVSQQKDRYSFFPFLASNAVVSYSAINVKNFYYGYYSLAYQKYLSNKWYISADLSGYYSHIDSEKLGIENKGYTQQVALSNYFIFPKAGQFGIHASYNSTDYADSYRFLPQYYLNLEYSKAIFRKKGSINISLSDVFNKLKDRQRYQLKDFMVSDNYKFETRLFKIALNYKFGNTAVKSVANPLNKSEKEKERIK